MGALQVPLTDVAWQRRQVQSEIMASFTGLLEDVTCDGAPLVQRLEQAFEVYFSDGWEAVSAQSGTAAEFLMLKALGIGAGDEVITVPNSDIATTAAISHTGARFTLVDVDRTSYNMDPDRVERLLRPAPGPLCRFTCTVTPLIWEHCGPMPIGTD
jgi:dTDP-4-amino-4,6-dideoxygalactose transaminase